MFERLLLSLVVFFAPVQNTLIPVFSNSLLRAVPPVQHVHHDAAPDPQEELPTLVKRLRAQQDLGDGLGGVAVLPLLPFVHLLEEVAIPAV